MYSVALLADPHFHNLDFSADGILGRRHAVRSLSDILTNGRFVNESYYSLRAALDDVVRQGLKVVVINGDLTEDGQESDLSGLLPLLTSYREQHGLMFFATFGNHDGFALSGRHNTKGFIGQDGRECLLSSDPLSAATYTADMYGLGYEDELVRMRDLGFFRQDFFLHWETPFGLSDELEGRRYTAISGDGSNTVRLIDASYLVEPVDGLWLLSIDSNVHLPRDGDIDLSQGSAFHDSKDGKWDLLVCHRPYMMDWIRDVVRRAEAAGKSLVAFSHYPVASSPWFDAPDGAFPGGEILRKSSPSRTTTRQVAATGLRLHFSGHEHVCTRSRMDELADVALPALCSFPPGFRRIDFSPESVRVDTVLLHQVDGFNSLFSAYRSQFEADPSLRPLAHGLLEAKSFGEFSSRHLAAAVKNVLAERHFGARFAVFAKTTSLRACLDKLAPGMARDVSAIEGIDELLLVDALVDWYRLDRAGALACSFLRPGMQALYGDLAAHLERPDVPLEPVWRDAFAFLGRLAEAARDPYPSEFNIGR